MIAGLSHRLRARLLTGALLLVLIGLQVQLARQIGAGDLPFRGLDAAPTYPAALASALGDGQFFYRSAGLRLQHVGSLDGRMIPLRDIDYQILSDWFFLLDDFDPQADTIPTMAAYLYSGTQDSRELHHLVSYLDAHGRRDPKRKWRWLANAVHLAHYREGDSARAMEIARYLAALPYDIPAWARQLELFILADMGETEAAIAIVQGILASDADIPEHERRWMEFYIRLLQERGDSRTSLPGPRR